MLIPSQLSIPENIAVSLPSGAKATLPLYHTVFKKWIGELPNFNFGNKPIIDYEGKAVFAELAILKLFTASGWEGVWVETYGGVHFLQDMPESWKLSQSHISIPKDKESLLPPPKLRIPLKGATDSGDGSHPPVLDRSEATVLFF